MIAAVFGVAGELGIGETKIVQKSRMLRLSE